MQVAFLDQFTGRAISSCMDANYIRTECVVSKSHFNCTLLPLLIFSAPAGHIADQKNVSVRIYIKGLKTHRETVSAPACQSHRAGFANDWRPG